MYKRDWKQELPMVGPTDYDAIACRYAAGVDVRPWNALCERPATLALLPGVGTLSPHGRPHHRPGRRDKAAESPRELIIVVRGETWKPTVTGRLKITPTSTFS